MYEIKIKMLNNSIIDIQNKNDEISFIKRRDFILSLVDENHLLEIATTESDSRLRGYAVRQLKIESNLLQIALNDNDKQVRIEAILNDNLKNPVYFDRIMESSSDPDIQSYAIIGVEDFSILFYTALNNKYIVTREIALAKLLNMELDAKIIIDLENRIPDDSLRKSIRKYRDVNRIVADI